MDLVSHFIREALEVSFWKESRIAAVMNTIRFLCLTGFVFLFISQVSGRVFKHTYFYTSKSQWSLQLPPAYTLQKIYILDTGCI